MNISKVSINFRSIYEKTQKQAENKLRNAAVSAINQKVMIAQGEMIRAFESHPVTMEIDGGVDSSNVSGTLGGYGNLFSFIGFESGQLPTQGLRDLLNERFQVVSRGLLKRGTKLADYRFEILVPSVLAMELETPMPWLDGESWASGIEDGISGVGQFLSIAATVSRSGGGIQVKADMGRSFSTQPYLSKILDAFLKAI